MTESNVLMWLDELRFCTENYESISRPLSDGADLALLFRKRASSQTWTSLELNENRSSGVETMGIYENLWECNTPNVNNNNNDILKSDRIQSEKEDLNTSELKHADVCRVSVIYQDCDAVEDAVEPVKVENVELYLTKDVLGWITDLWYSSEEEEIEEFEVRSKIYQKINYTEQHKF